MTADSLDSAPNKFGTATHRSKYAIGFPSTGGQAVFTGMTDCWYLLIGTRRLDSAPNKFGTATHRKR